MSDAPAKCRGGPDAEILAKIEKFSRAYSDWHTTRAAMYDHTLPNDEKSCDARGEKYDAAEMALLTTPAPMPRWLKWEALDRPVTQRGRLRPARRQNRDVRARRDKGGLLKLGLKTPEW